MSTLDDWLQDAKDPCADGCCERLSLRIVKLIALVRAKDLQMKNLANKLCKTNRMPEKVPFVNAWQVRDEVLEIIALTDSLGEGE